MLDQFIIFSKSGLVLFSVGKCRGNPVNDVIYSILMEDKGGKAQYSNDLYTIEWKSLNEYDIILMAIYSRVLGGSIKYVPHLFLLICTELSQLYDKELKIKPHKSCMIDFSKFNSIYEKILRKSQTKNDRIDTVGKNPTPFSETSKGKSLLKSQQKTGEKNNEKTKKSVKKTEKESNTNKKNRSWDDNNGRNKMDVNLYNLNNEEDNNNNNNSIANSSNKYPPGNLTNGIVDVENLDFSSSEEESDCNNEQESTQESSDSVGGVFGFFKSLVQKELTKENLEPVMRQICEHLIEKNVSKEIAEKLTSSVEQSLVEKKISTFQKIYSIVREAIAEALTRILIPKKSVDILHLISQTKSQARPFSIVFVGINGVGKSTSLAKVCAWLLKQKHKVMIAACDTFRSGAVEQLKDHARRLGGVPIFDQGYGKDSTDIARRAIAKAQKENYDVVLIDTAGRMQDNEPLMRTLANLVRVNKPDLILFVGEALVGNDSVDQLRKFNRVLEEQGDPVNPRTIDGIILTKFDTVDKKVGAAISMAYTSGKPIVFLGTGQTHGCLRTLNVKKIVDTLIK